MAQDSLKSEGIAAVTQVIDSEGVPECMRRAPHAGHSGSPTVGLQAVGSIESCQRPTITMKEAILRRHFRSLLTNIFEEHLVDSGAHVAKMFLSPFAHNPYLAAVEINPIQLQTQQFPDMETGHIGT